MQVDSSKVLKAVKGRKISKTRVLAFKCALYQKPMKKALHV